MEEQTIVVTREELYSKVWSTPMIILAKDYSISDVALRKICKKLQVPVPKIGYWQRKKSGLPVVQVPLPALPKGHNVTSHTIVKHDKREAPKDRPQNSEIETLIEYEKNEKNLIQVSQGLISPHPYVSKTEKHIRHSKPDIRGLIKPSIKGCLDIYVSPENIPRALAIMDAILKAFESRGYKATISDDENKTSVTIMDEDISFSISESYTRHIKELTPQQKKEQEKRSWMYSRPEYYYKTSGQLSLLIAESCVSNVRKQWSDGKRRQLEDLLNNFIIGLHNAANAKKEWRLEKERWERKWEERRQREAEESSRRMREESRIKYLNEQLQLLRKSREIREFISLWQQACLNCGGEIPPGSKVERWINWVQEYADRIDPLNEDHLQYYNIEDD